MDWGLQATHHRVDGVQLDHRDWLSVLLYYNITRYRRTPMQSCINDVRLYVMLHTRSLQLRELSIHHGCPELR